MATAKQTSSTNTSRVQEYVIEELVLKMMESQNQMSEMNDRLMKMNMALVDKFTSPREEILVMAPPTGNFPTATTASTNIGRNFAAFLFSCVPFSEEPIHDQFNQGTK